MATGKTSTLTVRIEPMLKDALRIAAQGEHRSVANMVEVIIRDYCAGKGISIAYDGNLSPNQRLADRPKRTQQIRKPLKKE
jgi:hypothetical protein